MFEVGEIVTGKFLKVTTRRDAPSIHMYTDVVGAIFVLGDRQWAKLPLSHALQQYSEGMTQRRLKDMSVGQTCEFEIIGNDVRDSRRYITVSEKVLAARRLFEQPKKLWTVTVVEPLGCVGKGLLVQFPTGLRVKAHKAWLGLGNEIEKVGSGSQLVVKLDYISLVDGPWFLHMRVVNPEHYRDHEVVGALPANFTIAADLASRSPDLAADFIKEAAA
jgi:hypothetical protein